MRFPRCCRGPARTTGSESTVDISVVGNSRTAWAFRRALPAAAADVAITDLLVLSHGWNNDHLTARLLYAALAASMRSVVDGVPGLAGRRIALACVLWPSRMFAQLELPAGSAALGTQLDE